MIDIDSKEGELVMLAIMIIVSNTIIYFCECLGWSSEDNHYFNSAFLLFFFIINHTLERIRAGQKSQQEKLDKIIKAQEGLKEAQEELKKESWEERRLAVKHLAKFIKYEHKTILEEIRGEYKK